MSTSVSDSRSSQTNTSAAKPRVRRRGQRSTAVRSVLAYGEPLIWLTGGSLVLCVVMILGLLGLVFSLGLGTFQPLPIVEIKLRDGGMVMGEVSKTEAFRLDADKLLSEPESVQQPLLESLALQAEDLSKIPTHIDRRMQQLQAEIAAVEARIVTAREQVGQLASQDKKASATPFERRDLIIKDDGDRDLQKARVGLVALENQLAALVYQLDVTGKAFDQFDAAESVTLASVLASDYDMKHAAIEALLRLVVDRQGEDAITRRRRMLRTGNYELTSEHFNWVADYQIAENGESLPPAAATVERVAWGRFYGTPDTFTLEKRREASKDEKQLEEIVQFFNRESAGLSEADAARVRDELERVQQKQQETISKNVGQFVNAVVEEFEGQHASIEVTTESGETKPIGQVSEEDNVAAAIVHWRGDDLAWKKFEDLHDKVRERFHHRRHLEKHALGRQYERQEHARLRLRQAELDHQVALVQPSLRLMEIERERLAQQQELQHADTILQQIRKRVGPDSQMAAVGAELVERMRAATEQSQQAPLVEQEAIQVAIASTSPKVQTLFDESLEVERSASTESAMIQTEIRSLKDQNSRYQLHMQTADGQPMPLALNDVVRAYQANQLSFSEKVRLYLSRWWEFLVDEPREANSEGGVLPAIWGTVTMTLIMSIAVVPFGVLAALYLREYAKSGPIVSAIRIAINNLAGVPSIVFGVFGLGFFCYIIGAYVDGGPRNAGFIPLVPARWYSVLGALAIFSLGAFVVGLIGFTGRHGAKSRLRRVLSYVSIGLWMVSLALFAYLLIKTPFFGGFYEANLPNPHWGKGGVVWAALTLALMTLPVVIVATEEALSAVPNSMREGSYGCGASKWQTIRRIVLPQALPGIMTGMILAMARGAGEVAPLMLVGAVKLAPELPLDMSFPFLHGNRSFMHLGFHIFDVGFQSQNSEAAKPMVYTTTLLLIVIITSLNLVAVWLRAYLRRRFVAGQF